MNELITKFNSYPLGQKILLLILLMCLMVVGFYFLHYQPYEAQYAAQQDKLEKLQDKRSKIAVLKESRTEVLNQLEKLKRQLLIAREQLPASAEIPSLLQRIHNQAKTAGLEIRIFQRVENNKQPYYTEIPVQMELTGTFDELANFFYYIGRMRRIVNVRNITLTRAKSGLKAEGELKVSALATTFMYNAQDQKKGGPGPKGSGSKPPRQK